MTACSAYDAALLKAPLRSGGGGTPAVQTGGSGGKGGSGGSPAAVDAGGTATGTPDSSTNETRCGDGQVTGEEKCDTGIDVGKAGACPIDCSALGPCSPRAFNGSGCQSECVLLQASCNGGDGCCPGTCTRANDSDCSITCGDGVVQTDSGETCEDGSKTPCPTLAECDDKDPCTTDALMGSAKNCNAACMHTPIAGLKDGDMCCPKGADANTDKDCAAKCGNGVREPGEMCDGSTGCSSDCQSNSLNPDQVRCLQDYASDPCEMCSCMNCAGANEYLACRDSDKAAGSQKCSSVIVCARKNKCSGTPCYCANDPLCGLFTGGPPGLCAAEIETAAGAAPGDTAAVNTAAMTPGTPPNALYLAYATDKCRVANCPSECR